MFDLDLMHVQIAGAACASNNGRAWAYPVDGNAPTFAGSTMRGEQRADVSQAFGGSFSHSGFHLDTAPLPAGTYNLVAYAMGPNGPIVERTVRVTVP